MKMIYFKIELAENESIINIWNLPSYFRLAVKNFWELTITHWLRKWSPTGPLGKQNQRKKK